ncbi:MAG: UDP-N-acetylmuramoyl-tripeptide--D-alanyl-D-alanine ligase [Verrucomicrobiales bacterium]|nr:UDP-N-acetylmuramoyl-tripeptide--D-alanyl-D-alanine ligase [Verrucomicrobiales bacterium]
MEPRSLKFVTEACGGELINGSPDAVVRGFSTDSRAVQRGEAFLALVGENFDAHTFVASVIEKGAAAIIAQPDRLPKDVPACPIISVANTRRALGQLASAYRGDFDLPLIAVGGSNGKTSTKELISSVLRQKTPTLASEASFNNDIGVPLTLLKLNASHRSAVIEVGTNHPGELAPLLQIIRPRFGVITSIGREHLEFFGDISGVLKEEGTVAEFLPANGTLFLNGDSEWSKPIVKRARAKPVWIGFNQKNDFRARNIHMDESGSSFLLECSQKNLSGEYRLRLFGKHQVLNALFAIAVGAELGLTRIEIQRGLAECAPAKWRMEHWSFQEFHVLDDCYNANADSMLAALETLKEFPCKGRRIAFLGDMGELGMHSVEAHREVGSRVAEMGINQLFAVGKFAQETAEAARKSGLKNVEAFSEVTVAGTTLKKFLRPGDVVLLKASRAMRLERVSEFLKQTTAQDLCKT